MISTKNLASALSLSHRFVQDGLSFSYSYQDGRHVFGEEVVYERQLCKAAPTPRQGDEREGMCGV